MKPLSDSHCGAVWVVMFIYVGVYAPCCSVIWEQMYLLVEYQGYF